MTLPLSHWLPPLSSRGPGWSSTATEAPPPEADGGKEPELAAASFKTGSTKKDKSTVKFLIQFWQLLNWGALLLEFFPVYFKHLM